MSPLRYQKWLRLNEVRRPMLNEHYDDSESMNQTVELGQVRSSRLAKAGDLSSAVGSCQCLSHSIMDRKFR